MVAFGRRSDFCRYSSDRSVTAATCIHAIVVRVPHIGHRNSRSTNSRTASTFGVLMRRRISVTEQRVAVQLSATSSSWLPAGGFAGGSFPFAIEISHDSDCKTAAGLDRKTAG